MKYSFIIVIIIISLIHVCDVYMQNVENINSLLFPLILHPKIFYSNKIMENILALFSWI